MQTFLRSVLAVVSTGCLLLTTGAASGATSQADNTAGSQPNFVIIVAEGLGWAGTSVEMDAQNDGSRHPIARTPNLERLAASGVRFSHGYAASPRCTPSRAALLTGISPAALHMTYVGRGRNNRVGPDAKLQPPLAVTELPSEATTYAEVLRDAGYGTAHFGKWHVGSASPDRHGFDQHDGANNNNGPNGEQHPNRSQVTVITARGIAFMEAMVADNRPFALQLDHYHTSQAEDAHPDTLEAWQGQADRINRRQLGAAAALADVDRAIGDVLDSLDRLGVADNTYIIFTADHGAPGQRTNGMLNGGKGGLYEGGIRVPFIISGREVAAGRAADTPVVGMDILPTVIELAGVDAEVAGDVEGVSLFATLRDPKQPIDRNGEGLVFHFPHYDLDTEGPATAIRFGQYKLIHHYATNHTKLFDLTADPGETIDLATKHPDKVTQLRTLMDAHLSKVDAAVPTPNPNYDPTAEPSRRVPRRQRGRR